ncbi:MAG: hypothetical protein LBB26_00955 [Puniceicoccales bacterium]|jgi:hypothetical protein|nr:hypothetical protein [Puniceicoccales bacterium]
MVRVRHFFIRSVFGERGGWALLKSFAGQEFARKHLNLPSALERVKGPVEESGEQS